VFDYDPRRFYKRRLSIFDQTRIVEPVSVENELVSGLGLLQKRKLEKAELRLRGEIRLFQPENP
jgi:hypothetical protein